MPPPSTPCSTRFWGGGPLDALVNNAAGNFIARTEELSPRAIDAVLGIVLHGTLYMTLGSAGAGWRRPGRHRAHHRHHLRLDRLGLRAAFGVAKAGVLAMTRCLAVEWGGRACASTRSRRARSPPRAPGSAWCRAPIWPAPSNQQSAGPPGRHASSPTSRPSCCRRARLHQRRGRHHRRRRVAAGRRPVQLPGGHDGRRLAGGLSRRR